MAFLSFDWDYEIVAEYYRGMEDYLAEHRDMRGVIFNAFGHYHKSYEAEPGSYEVFSLCNPHDFDGFLIQGNRSWPPALRQQFVNRFRSLGKPVVSINYDLEGAHSVGTNNYEAMYDLVTKVVLHHGCMRPAFVNGLATSVEAQDRARAFRDACRDCGVSDSRFYQANWQTEAGVEAAHAMLGAPDDLPDVIFCCNDDLAIGVQGTLQESGVRVPDDVMITGFDNREISSATTPRITTVDRDYRTVAITALDALRQLMDGAELPNRLFSPIQYHWRDSCRCENRTKPHSMSDLYKLDNSLKHFYEVVSHFQSDILNATSIRDVLGMCDSYAHEVRCPNVFVTLNDRYMHSEDSSGTHFGPISHLAVCEGGIRLEHNERHVYATFLTEQLLPPQIPLDAPLYIVYGLHRNGSGIGTFVTEGLSPIAAHGFLAFALTLLSVAIENARKTRLLTEANARLNDLYVHDELTGLFNRFGLKRFGTPTYERLLNDQGFALIIFVDIDNMKLVNDTYGHKAGDEALRDTADIIHRASLGEDAFYMRYGGDEFLLISRNNIQRKIEDQLGLLKGTTMHPFDLNLSIGVFEVRREYHYSIEEAITRADAKMYEIKRARRPR